jgi:DNA gyrase subunit A
VRTGADEVSLVGRNTQGVRLIAVRDDERLVQVARIVEAIASGDVAGAAGAPPPAAPDAEFDAEPDTDDPADDPH